MAVHVARPLLPSETSAARGDGLLLVMIWLLLAAAWCLAGFKGGVWRPINKVVLASLLALLGCTAAAVVYGHDSGPNRASFNLLWEWIALGAGFILLRQLIARRIEARAGVSVMLALAIVLSLDGLYQFFYDMPRTRAAYLANPRSVLREAGLVFEAGTPALVQFEQRLASTEPTATFELANSLAGWLATWLVVCLGLLATGFPAGSKLSGRCRWALAVMAAVMFACLLLTKSRSALAALAVGGVLVAGSVIDRRRMMRGAMMALGVAAVLTAAAWAARGLDREMLTESAKSLGYRREYWQATAELIRANPIVGVGVGNFQDAYTHYKLPTASEEIADPHQFLLEICATSGIPAGLALVVLLTAGVWELFRPPASDRQADMTALDSPAIDPGAAGSRFPWLVYAGAALGLPLAWLAGQLGTVQLSTNVLSAALVVGPLVLIALAPWVRNGRLPASVLGSAIVTMLVNLLGAGGIGFPGVASTLWLLLAIGQALIFADKNTPSAPAIVKLASSVWWTGGLIVSAALAITAYLTAYQPVLNARVFVERAMDDAENREGLLRSACAADPWAAEPRQLLAEYEYRRFRDRPTAEQQRRFEDALSAALANQPFSAKAWLRAGTMHLEAAAKSDDDALARQAVDSCRRAAELYPNDATIRGWLALALADVGDEQGAVAERAQAMKLDQLTPHIDRQLSHELRQRLDRMTFQGAPRDGATR